MKKKLLDIGILAALLFLLIFMNLTAQTIEEGTILVQQKNFSAARSVFDSILTKDDENAEAHFQLGMVHLSRWNPERNIDEAADHLEKAAELDPDNAEYQFQYGIALGKKARKAGTIRQLFITPGIKDAFVRAVELNPGHLRARIALAEFYLTAPSIVGGDVADGWKEFDEAIKLDEVAGRSAKASILERKQRSDEAEKEYIALAASKPEDWRVWRKYGYFRLRAERTDDALEFFNKYVQLRPDTADSYNSVGTALMKKGEIDRAVEMFRKALEIDTNYVPSMHKLGEAYQMKGQNNEAKEMFKAVLKNYPSEYYRKSAEKKLVEIK